MSFKDEYFLAREYAASMFDTREDGFYIAVSAFLAGNNVGHRGLKKSMSGDKITRIAFFFSTGEREFVLKHPIYVLDRLDFLHQLRQITGIKEIGIYE